MQYAQVLATCMGSVDIPDIIPNITSMVVTVIKIAVPVILIIMGMLDLGKAVMAQKDDEIKKAQSTFIKRIIAAVLVFFVVAIVQLVFSVLASADKGNNNINDQTITSCINLFLNGSDSVSVEQ